MNTDDVALSSETTFVRSKMADAATLKNILDEYKLYSVRVTHFQFPLHFVNITTIWLIIWSHLCKPSVPRVGYHLKTLNVDPTQIPGEWKSICEKMLDLLVTYQSIAKYVIPVKSLIC